jgi:3-phosphoshikimate 1-carboxyvinyltransferase
MDITLSRAAEVDIRISAPPSKSYTHRALLAAALGKGESTLRSPLRAGDTAVTVRSLRLLGVPIRERDGDLIVEGRDGAFSPGRPVTISCENSGTTLRLLASAALLSHDTVILTGIERMKERPIGPLVDALNAIGGDITYLERRGYPPIAVEGSLTGGATTLDASASSQFASSLLMSAPYANEQVVLTLEGHVASRSYLDLTLAVMDAFGVRVKRSGYHRFEVSPGGYRGRTYAIEGDYSSSSFFFAIAAVCGGRVTVDNLNPHSVQGDRRMLAHLEAMGCTVRYGTDSVTVERTGDLEGIEVDMSASPDTVQTLSAVAPFARSPTRITGIGHLRIKESDRVRAIRDSLHQLGVKIDIGPDEIIIYPGIVHSGTINPRNDHRTAMAGAILGLGAGGVSVQSAECVEKSYPGFWEALRGAGLCKESC